VLVLRTAADAKTIDAHFNGFHDGFIKSLTLRSLDRFEAHGPDVTDIGHVVTGDFEAEIEFAHYNYGQGAPPTWRVGASLHGVRDIHIDLRRIGAAEWPIRAAEFASQDDGRFAFEVVWGRLTDEGWSTQRLRLLTFSEARFGDIVD